MHGVALLENGTTKAHELEEAAMDHWTSGEDASATSTIHHDVDRAISIRKVLNWSFLRFGRTSAGRCVARKRGSTTGLLVNSGDRAGGGGEPHRRPRYAYGVGETSTGEGASQELSARRARQYPDGLALVHWVPRGFEGSSTAWTASKKAKVPDSITAASSSIRCAEDPRFSRCSEDGACASRVCESERGGLLVMARTVVVLL